MDPDYYPSDENIDDDECQDEDEDGDDVDDDDDDDDAADDEYDEQTISCRKGRAQRTTSIIDAAEVSSSDNQDLQLAEALPVTAVQVLPVTAPDGSALELSSRNRHTGYRGVHIRGNKYQACFQIPMALQKKPSCRRKRPVEAIHLGYYSTAAEAAAAVSRFTSSVQADGLDAESTVELLGQIRAAARVLDPKAVQDLEARKNAVKAAVSPPVGGALDRSPDGLPLYMSPGTQTGYRGVVKRTLAQGKYKRNVGAFMAKYNNKFIGTFDTPYDAACAFARHVAMHGTRHVAGPTTMARAQPQPTPTELHVGTAAQVEQASTQLPSDLSVPASSVS